MINKPRPFKGLNIRMPIKTLLSGGGLLFRSLHQPRKRLQLPKMEDGVLAIILCLRATRGLLGLRV